MRFVFSHYRGRCVGWRRALHFSVNEEFWSEDILPNRQGTKTQWIGWLNWGFRSWPLIRFVRTRKSKSQSRKDNSGFYVPKTAQAMTVAQNSANGVEEQNQQRSNIMRWERWPECAIKWSQMWARPWRTWFGTVQRSKFCSSSQRSSMKSKVTQVKVVWWRDVQSYDSNSGQRTFVKVMSHRGLFFRVAVDDTSVFC